jgi:hypothetical protein
MAIPTPILWNSFRSDHLIPVVRVLDPVDKHPKMKLEYIYGAMVPGASSRPLLVQTPRMRGVALSTQRQGEGGRMYVDGSVGFKMNGVSVTGSQVHDFYNSFVSPLEQRVAVAVEAWLNSDLASQLKPVVSPGEGAYDGTLWAKLELDVRGKPKTCSIFDEHQVNRSFQELQKALKEQNAEMQALLEVQSVFYLKDKMMYGVNICVRGIQYFPDTNQILPYNFIELPPHVTI